MSDVIKCDYCGEESVYVPVIEKPQRFFYGEHVHLMVQAYTDLGDQKIKDNICVNCLNEELDMLKDTF